MELHFERVNRKNRAEIERLELFPAQAGFIESVSECLREADELELWRPVGIYDGPVLVGFAMYGFFPKPAPGQLWLDRLLIDKKYQGRGYGRQAVLGLLERVYREYPCGQAYLSVYRDNVRAIRLYSELGFRFNGEYDTKGESVMVYELAPVESSVRIQKSGRAK